MPATKDDGQIWIDNEHKLRGICRETRELTAAGRDVLLLAHFDKLVRGIEVALRAESIAYRSYSGFDDSVLFLPRDSEGPTLWVGLALNFHPRATITRDDGNARSLSIIVAEHHPWSTRDQAIIDAANTLPRETRICFHAALTDALLVHFGSEQIQHLYKALGVDEQTSLSNHLIDNAIRSAQDKLAKRVFTELPTSSAEDWFKYNLRERK